MECVRADYFNGQGGLDKAIPAYSSQDFRTRTKSKTFARKLPLNMIIYVNSSLAII